MTSILPLSDIFIFKVQLNKIFGTLFLKFLALWPVKSPQKVTGGNLSFSFQLWMFVHVCEPSLPPFPFSKKQNLPLYHEFGNLVIYCSPMCISLFSRYLGSWPRYINYGQTMSLCRETRRGKYIFYYSI